MRLSMGTMLLITILVTAFMLSAALKVRKARRLPKVNRRMSINFSCTGRAMGYYADVDFDCRVFHICDNFGRRIPIHCPPHTKFNQMYRVCDWPHNVDCQDSPAWYYVNGEAPQEEAANHAPNSVSASTH